MTHRQIKDGFQMSWSPRDPKVKRAKTIHSAAAGGFCWSCKAGGMGESCSKAVSYLQNCCKACFNSRRCNKCADFNTVADSVWCVRCELRIAAWCHSCHDEDVLQKHLCLRCLDTQGRRELRAAAAQHSPKLPKFTCGICGPTKPATRKQTAFGKPLCRT